MASGNPWQRRAAQKCDCTRPRMAFDIDDARPILPKCVANCSDECLASGIGYIAPKEKVEGRGEAILA